MYINNYYFFHTLEEYFMLGFSLPDAFFLLMNTREEHTPFLLLISLYATIVYYNEMVDGLLLSIFQCICLVYQCIPQASLFYTE